MSSQYVTNEYTDSDSKSEVGFNNIMVNGHIFDLSSVIISKTAAPNKEECPDGGDCHDNCVYCYSLIPDYYYTINTITNKLITTISENQYENIIKSMNISKIF